MSELTQKDLNILKHYANQTHNRELYWNYLAQLPGNDGYGLLALGVVRNDNMPGAVANIYAQTHGGRKLTEREWDAFGQQLIQEDFKLRQAQFVKNHDPRAALNLPVKDVQEAHDKTFSDHELNKNAWTPRLLLEAARHQGGEKAAERVWSNMLDNSLLGLDRGTSTTAAIAQYMPRSEALNYTGRLGAATALAVVDRANVDPNVIGANNFYYHYTPKDRSWTSVAQGDAMSMPVMRAVTQPALLKELNDTRQLRLERQEKATQFHPADPYREIARSPRTLAQQDVPESALPATQRASLSLPADFAPPLQIKNDLREPDQPGHAAYGHAKGVVRRMEFEKGIPEGEHTQILAARVMAEAAERKQGITRMEMDRNGQIQVIERHYAMEEGRRFSLDASEAMSQSVAQSSARWLATRSTHYQADQPAPARSDEQSLALSRLNAADQSMFGTIRGRTPAQIGDDTVVQAMTEAKRNHIHDARGIESVTMHGNHLHVLGTVPGFGASVDVTAAAPPIAQSMAVNESQNQMRQQMQTQQQEQERVQEQARSIGMG